MLPDGGAAASMVVRRSYACFSGRSRTEMSINSNGWMWLLPWLVAVRKHALHFIPCCVCVCVQGVQGNVRAVSTNHTNNIAHCVHRSSRSRDAAQKHRTHFFYSVYSPQPHTQKPPVPREQRTFPAKMWFEILIPFTIITAALSAPGYALYALHSWQLGNAYRRGMEQRFDRMMYVRDSRLTGNPYRQTGLEGVGDDDDDGESLAATNQKTKK